ncbi:hypothetical protein IMSHALPRED_003447 [Imshaugia aleurites]|uniref:Uncharacterized protein n=1 Tax=Imshaugia aleurites TaxID=172621 RepID=A0A8H3J7J1_9LECA|nr:hypothetical protein IMSHALPRED_003447 [Imshaugia aleurites]
MAKQTFDQVSAAMWGRNALDYHVNYIIPRTHWSDSNIREEALYFRGLALGLRLGAQQGPSHSTVHQGSSQGQSSASTAWNNYQPATNHQNYPSFGMHNGIRAPLQPQMVPQLPPLYGSRNPYAPCPPPFQTDPDVFRPTYTPGLPPIGHLGFGSIENYEAILKMRSPTTNHLGYPAQGNNNSFGAPFQRAPPFQSDPGTGIKPTYTPGPPPNGYLGSGCIGSHSDILKMRSGMTIQPRVPPDTTTSFAGAQRLANPVATRGGGQNITETSGAMPASLGTAPSIPSTDNRAFQSRAGMPPHHPMPAPYREGTHTLAPTVEDHPEQDFDDQYGYSRFAKGKFSHEEDSDDESMYKWFEEQAAKDV